jgi:hypothetical protein
LAFCYWGNTELDKCFEEAKRLEMIGPVYVQHTAAPVQYMTQYYDNPEKKKKRRKAIWSQFWLEEQDKEQGHLNKKRNKAIWRVAYWRTIDSTKNPYSTTVFVL